MTTAHEELAHAWAERLRRLYADLMHALQAPALFKPERVEEMRADYAKAQDQMKFWMDQ